MSVNSWVLANISLQGWSCPIVKSVWRKEEECMTAASLTNAADVACVVLIEICPMCEKSSVTEVWVCISKNDTQQCSDTMNAPVVHQQHLSGLKIKP